MSTKSPKTSRNRKDINPAPGKQTSLRVATNAAWVFENRERMDTIIMALRVMDSDNAAGFLERYMTMAESVAGSALGQKE